MVYGGRNYDISPFLRTYLSHKLMLGWLHSLINFILTTLWLTQHSSTVTDSYKNKFQNNSPLFLWNLSVVNTNYNKKIRIKASWAYFVLQPCCTKFFWVINTWYILLYISLQKMIIFMHLNMQPITYPNPLPPPPDPHTWDELMQNKVIRINLFFFVGPNADH